jgi:hypothetical protein
MTAVCLRVSSTETIRSENHKNSLGSCPGDQPDYELEFCPGGSSYEGNAGGDTKYLNQISSHETCAAKPLLVS